ncbi:hypothetical protein GCK72_003252 [Caenorhabditis remanei]|uniref:Fungal lipase-type domain-containing protein n=1 Tax=Caenorhabditis remanei TaxID=31234 RepID=A0A6A5HWW6_CAERE|nr:hypothetical protein GCK72_003252 [Caenorhabditis remanei]KAF1771426.1 hypothetical protein GCK72_003252 [Caenorhabditis remanei]
MESLQCVSSKYMCHPWRTVTHEVNCPVRVLPTTFNDSFNRFEIAHYIHAANRVAETVPVGGPMSCLMKIPQNIQLLFELNVPTTLERKSIGVVIGVNHNYRHIFIGFRSTNDLFQLIAQYVVFTMGWMEDFPLGGKMVAIYVQIYKDILNFGFDASLEQAVSLFPTYSLLVTGHSLGGAMATVFSLHVALRYPLKPVSLYAWSGPRSGDETFVRMLREHLTEQYRVVRDGDPTPDFPLRVSQTVPTPHHNTFEVFYPTHMTTDNYKICNQAESETCLKGSWWKTFFSHIFMFDMNFLNHQRMGYCNE